MSASTVNAWIQRVRIDASQDWNVAAGRVLTIGRSDAVLVPSANVGSLNRQGQLTVNANGFTITKKGAGTVQLDTGNASLGALNWRFEGGVVKALWNEASAWGTGTLTLAGGGISVGTPVAGSVGNWTWNNSIILEAATGITPLLVQ